MPETECSTWAELARDWPDPRARRGRRYAWATLLILLAAAVASGEHSGAALTQWVAEHAAEWQAWLPTAHGRIPSAATLRRVLRQVDVAELERRVGRWVAGQLEAAERRAAGGRPAAARGRRELRAVAADGKTLRGAKARGATGAHLLSLVTHERAQVLAQCAVDDKSNEIPALRALLAGRDLEGWLVTADALHAQVETAALIRAGGGHYLLVVKGNQPDRYAALAEWFAAPAWIEEREQTIMTSGKGHGRIERRTTTRRVLAARQTLEWPGVRQAVRRECWARELASGHERHEVTYAVTSLPPEVAGAAELEGYWRGHWTIENCVHYVRDVDYREDAGQAHVGATHEVVAALCNGVLSQLRLAGWTEMARALRHLAASVPRVLAFLGCPAPAT
jgi:predicted transposase YbfD/YdcC